MNKIEIKLPSIPGGLTAEVHQYYIELHKSFKKLESAINELNSKVGA